MNVRERVDSLITAPNEDTLEIAGQRLAARGEASAWAERYRQAITERFLERRPNATEHTWHHFLMQLKGYARQMDGPSERALQDILVLVDGL